MLAPTKRNIGSAKEGVKLISPFIKYSFRLEVRIWILFAIANNPEEVIPWAIIRRIAPLAAQVVFVIRAAIIKAICLIDLYAISAFKSDCRKQLIPAKMAPIRERDEISDSR